MNEKYLVIKANQLVTSHYSLSLEELRIILTLISLVQPDDEEFKPYEFKIAEFIKMLGIKDPSKYTELPKITKGLMKKIFEIKEGNTIAQIAWFYYVKYDKGTGIITLKFAPELKPYLLGLKKLFTAYRLENVLMLTSKYSIRMYEILKCNEYRQTIIIDLSELTEILKLSKAYSDFAQIKRRIIEPSQRELAEKTDITFDYETVTVRKKVTALKFTIKPNPKNKPKLNQNNNQLVLPKPAQKQLMESSNKPTQDDIQAIKDEFQRRYKGKLVDKFVKEMIQEKGLAHVQECLRTYPDYTKGQKNITNIGGHFRKFVMEGYEKPVAYNGNVPPIAQPVFFTATKKEAENLYTKEKRVPSEVATTAINEMYSILGVQGRKKKAKEDQPDVGK